MKGKRKLRCQVTLDQMRFRADLLIPVSLMIFETAYRSCPPDSKTDPAAMQIGGFFILLETSLNPFTMLRHCN